MNFFTRQGRALLLAATLFLLVCGGVAFAQPTISAVQLKKEYSENQMKFDNNYKGKRFYVTGTIKNIDKDILDRYYIALETGEWSVVTINIYNVSPNLLAELKKGQSVRVLVEGVENTDVRAVLSKIEDPTTSASPNQQSGRGASTTPPPATNAPASAVKAKIPADLVPTGYKISKEVKGDLNKDGLEDYVFVIEDGSCSGIVIVFNMGEYYENMLENRKIFCICFDEIDVSIMKGILGVKTVTLCGGGLSEQKSYKFRFQNSDFELIGFDYSSNACGLGYGKKSINILSKKMQYDKNNGCGDGKGKKIEEVWSDIVIKEPIKLRKIDDIGEFDVMEHITVK